MTRFPRLYVLMLATLAVAIACATAQAQPPRGGQGRPRGPGFGGGPGMMGGGLIGLLRNPQVLDELKATDAQREQLRKLGEKIGQEMREAFPRREGDEDLSREERMKRFQEAMEKIRQQAEKRAPEIEKQVAGILDDAQFKRLKQLQFQREGIDALLRAEVVQALALTEDQQKTIKGVIEQRNKKMEQLGEQMRGAFSGGFRELSDEEREEFRKKMEKMGEQRQAIQNEAQKNAMGVLTAEQKAKLPGVMGDPFEFRRPEGPGGPGRGRFGAGRPGEGQREGGRAEGGRKRRPGGDRGEEGRKRRPE